MKRKIIVNIFTLYSLYHFLLLHMQVKFSSLILPRYGILPFLKTLLHFENNSFRHAVFLSQYICPACPASWVGKVELLMLSVSFQLKLEANPEIPECTSRL